MPLQTNNTTEPIAGYKLLERLGAGGYGEVWKAEAPGGLLKAVKLVYGYLDEDRASREMKALQRVKEVRHPFLLSLERIEVVNGQLVIVTELADCCLKDCFDAHRAKNQTGVPRDELLQYLADAADALDYMSAHHQLQHLDVKPENLLMVGGRVKVADFGLVKEVSAITGSMMGGLTPIYAPPEVFDGRPSLFSDQYSLAIVFQEMLTGVLPFPGATAAQLAAQHLHSRPRLSALPPGDQPIIARALEKKADLRYVSCKELIEALRNVGRAAPPPRDSRPHRAADGLKAAPHTERAERSGGGAAAVAPRAPVGAPWVEHALVELPTLQVEASQVALSPTVFLGLGGTATQVLCRLRRQIFDRLGDLTRLPAVGLLAADTDAKALILACQGEGQQRLEAEQVLAMPLRSPQNYRQSPRFAQAVGRRWLYNLPRSQQTEGLRPLGRLAFVDHAAALRERLTEVIRQVCDPAAVEASGQTAGFPFAAAPRVVIVASLAGASGGYLLEAARMAREVLDALGFEEGRVEGLLAYSARRNPEARQLAAANALACLSEWRHYHQHGFPGDALADLAPSAPEQGLFDDAYLLDWGEELADEAYQVGVHALADYAYLDAVTAARGFFAACRRSRGAGEFSLRAFGLRRVGSPEEFVRECRQQLSAALLAQWCGETTPTPSNPSRPRAATVIGNAPAPIDPAQRELQEHGANLLASRMLTPDKLAQLSQNLLERELGGDLERRFNELLAESRKHLGEASVTERLGDFLLRVDALVGGHADGQQHPPTPLEEHLRGRVEAECEKHAAVLLEWLLGLLDGAAGRIKAAWNCGVWLATELKRAREQTFGLRQRQIGELGHLGQTLGLGAGEAAPAVSLKASQLLSRRPPADVDRLLFRWFTLRVSELAYRGAAAGYDVILRRVGEHLDRLRVFRRDFTFLLQQAAPADDGRPDNADAAFLLDPLRAHFQQRCPELARELETTLRQQFFNDEAGLRRAFEEGWDVLGKLPPALQAAATRIARAARQQVNVLDIVLQAGTPKAALDRVREFLEQAHPRLARRGTGKRLLLVTPSNVDGQSLTELCRLGLDENPSLLADPDGDLVLCREIEGVSLAAAADHVTQNRGECQELAARLHGRCDVPFELAR